MANKYEVYRLETEMVMILQCEAVETGSKISAPLIHSSDVTRAFSQIMPEVIIDGEKHYLDTQNMASVDERKLRNRVGDFSEYRELVNHAVDLLFTGF